MIPASATWLLKLTFRVKLKTTSSPAASPSIVKTLLLVVLKLVTVNTRLPLASRCRRLALMVVEPLMAMGVPGSGAELGVEGVDGAQGRRHAGDAVSDPSGHEGEGRVRENWPLFAAEKSISPLMRSSPPVDGAAVLRPRDCR